jgi:hypothetical protein
MSSKLSSIEKSLNHQFKNPVVINIIRVLIVVYIIFLTAIPLNILSVFENTLFQIAYLALLAYMALVDPVSAILMAAAYLLTIQQLNRPVILKKDFYNNSMYNSMDSIQSNLYKTEQFQEMAHPLVSLNPTNQHVQSLNAPLDGDHPAFKTMTENIAQKTTFTTDTQFQDAQSNFLPNVNQNNGIKSLSNQFGAQGVDLPRGYDSDIYLGSQF